MHDVKLESAIHVETPDEPGILGRVMGTLANAGVNLKAINAYSSKNKGIFILLTSDNKKASTGLKALGYKVKSEEVVSILICDRIGAGAEIGALLGNAVIDVDYCIGTSVAEAGKVLFIIKTSNNRIALETLR